MSKTGNDLLNDVQLTITMPNNQVLLTDERVLHFANDEMFSTVQEVILALNQEYFVVLDESETTQSGQHEYSIPYRSIGRTLRDLKIRDVGGTGNNVWNCVQVALEDAQVFQTQSSNNFAYYFKGDLINLVPEPLTNLYRLMKYYLLRPNKIVKTDAAGLITGVSGNIVTLNLVPDTLVAGTPVDFIQGIQGNRTLAMDQVITNVAGNQVTISTPPTSAQIGDWVSVAETSPVIQLPDEAFTFLVMLTAKRCLYAVGDFDGVKVLDEMIPAKKQALEMMLAPRNEGEQTKIVNRRGLLRTNRLGIWPGVFR